MVSLSAAVLGLYFDLYSSVMALRLWLIHSFGHPVALYQTSLHRGPNTRIKFVVNDYKQNESE